MTRSALQLIVSEETHPELFWAMRGVGSAFGIVTKLKLRLHDVSDCLGGSIMVPYSRSVDPLPAVLALVHVTCLSLRPKDASGAHAC